LPQAVIVALHATAPRWEQTDWATICTGYDRLLAVADSPVARANRALAVGFRDGCAAGLAALDAVADDPRLAGSGLVPSIRADLLRRATGRRWSSPAPSRRRCFCSAASPSAVGSSPRRKSATTVSDLEMRPAWGKSIALHFRSSRCLVSDRKIPKVSGQAEGYPAELAEPGYGARVCISKAMPRVGE
jgi:hypothetical protein